MTTSIADIREVARKGYLQAHPVERFLALARPSICPFHILLDQVPGEAESVLDIGCGTGLFVNSLAAKGTITSAVGIDVSSRALTAAIAASQLLTHDQKVEFRAHDVAAGLPDGQFDLVSMIDVMHHVEPDSQLNALREAISRLAPGGILLYKDMVDRPHWRAWANRCHDLLLARQWIHYLPLTEVLATAHDEGLTLVHQQRINTLWYGHELAVMKAPG